MKFYKIDPEYLDNFGTSDADYVVSESEAASLAREWEKPLEDVLAQLYELSDAEVNLEILVADRCTRSEAKKFLKDGCTVYELSEFIAHSDDYLDYLDADERSSVLSGLEKGVAPADHSIVDFCGVKFYIEYVL